MKSIAIICGFILAALLLKAVITSHHNTVVADATYLQQEITKEDYQLVIKAVKSYPELKPMVYEMLKVNGKLNNAQFLTILKKVKELINKDQRKQSGEIDI
jgi:hypothetical protein